MYLKQLINSKQTVFSINDLSKVWKIENRSYLRVVANRLCRRGEIARIQRGIYVISQDYDCLELANKLKFPSYVSLETVLQRENIIFQDFGKTIFSVSNNAIFKKAGEKAFQYSKIADKILSNPLGIIRVKEAYVASPERAVCDRVYLSPGYFFDNIRPLKTEKLEKLSRIYNKRVRAEVEEIINKIKKYA